MNLTIGDVLTLKHLGAHNISMPEKRTFTGVSTDSRTVARGELFVALRGENFDGNRFVARAFRRGAAAAIVDSRAGRRGAGKHPVIVVRDGVKALGALAALYRRKFSLPVIAVAGSNGKTTAKEMIASVLSKKFRVLRTSGNLNNEIGVPLTLFGIRRGHEVAVIEIGTNHFGEVKRLARIAAPTHGIITNIGGEHLRYFRDLDGVARAEGELYDYLEEQGGTVFVNADDPRLRRMSERMLKRMKRSTGRLAEKGRVRITRYGFTGPGRAVRGGAVSVDQRGRPEFSVQPRTKNPFRVRMSVPGTHNASNGLAAAAVGLEFGVGRKSVCTALSCFRAVGKRMETVRAGGVTILNDTYNANPASVESALETLSLFTGRGKKIVVLADMLELGADAAKEHMKIGRRIAKLGFRPLFCYGPMAKRYCRGSGRGRHFDDKRALARELRKTARRGDVVLVKGSRGMKMEEIVGDLVRHLGRAA